MIFSPKNSRGRQSSTLRILLMLVLFIGVGYLFWKNYERTMTSIQSQHIIQDETGTLSSDFQNDVANFSRNFQQRFGIAIQVKIFEGFVISPPEDPRIIFIGLSPRYEEWSVVFPMLLRRALSEKFITYFQTEHFAEYWENGQWVKGLADALNILGQEMTQIEKDS